MKRFLTGTKSFNLIDQLAVPVFRNLSPQEIAIAINLGFLELLESSFQLLDSSVARVHVEVEAEIPIQLLQCESTALC